MICCTAVSAKSDAWYAVPENRERRKRNMVSYAAAMTRLAARYPDERRKAYARQRQRGDGHFLAFQRAYGTVRDAHPAEFRELLAELRAAQP